MEVVEVLSNSTFIEFEIEIDVDKHPRFLLPLRSIRMNPLLKKNKPLTLTFLLGQRWIGRRFHLRSRGLLSVGIPETGAGA